MAMPAPRPATSIGHAHPYGDVPQARERAAVVTPERLPEAGPLFVRALMTTPMPTLTGYSVIGRQGKLGTVVDGLDGGHERLAFRGGISNALLFHVPMSRVGSISTSQRTVTIDLDVGDFTPRRGRDGTVELFLAA